MLVSDTSHKPIEESPFTNRAFRKLFAAQIIALLGTGLASVALALLAYDLAGGHAGVVLGQALAVKMFAYVIFAPLFGGIAHRFNRKRYLISLDLLRAATVLAMPFVDEVWQIYLLIFLLNTFSAGFKPVYQSIIPELMPDERTYTRALTYSRLAYDLENLLSPMLAGLALLFFSYDTLFVANAGAFVCSAFLILITLLPVYDTAERPGGVWHEISFGVRAYLKTPRLRAMLCIYFGVACASAMIIVNTVVYIRNQLGGTETDVALALAASGAGSMIAALSMPKILGYVQDRTVMLLGSALMAMGLISVTINPGFLELLLIWFVIGMGWSLVQTPAGRVVNRSSNPSDRASYFSAQFSLTHACWMIAYPLAGQLGLSFGISVTGLILGAMVVISGLLGAWLWPHTDPLELMHHHDEISHTHRHLHDDHHQHHQSGMPVEDNHEHRHPGTTHSHEFVIDDHHPRWPDERPG